MQTNLPGGHSVGKHKQQLWEKVQKKTTKDCTQEPRRWIYFQLSPVSTGQNWSTGLLVNWSTGHMMRWMCRSRCMEQAKPQHLCRLTGNGTSARICPRWDLSDLPISEYISVFSIQLQNFRLLDSCHRVIYHQDPQILSIQDLEYCTSKDLRILNHEDFLLFEYLKFSGFWYYWF